MDREIKVVPNMTELVREAADRIVDAARRAIAEKGSFSIALSGGHTPKGLYELLASEPYRSAIDWPNVEIYFGDERSVPPDSDQSNFRMANEALLSKVPIPRDHIHRIRGEIDPNTAAIEYGQLLKQKFGDGGLDMALLGMGDDGHTASLFPGTAALHETHHRAVANHVEKLNAWRVTMSAPFLNRSREIMILISGADKAKRAAEVLEGPREPERLPIQMIEPRDGKVTWLLDAAAAGMHDDE
ncbi:MAG: pgl [Phycisphaerales bacterium]|nr:pgl [Phycisphaerales bacterium]